MHSSQLGSTLVRLLPLFASLSWLLGSPSAVYAHARFPAATGVVISADGQRVPYVRTTFGVLQRDASDRGWGWICPEAIGSHEREDPAVVLNGNGDLVVAHRGGVAVSSDGCHWDQIGAPLRGLHVAALAQDPAEPQHLYAVTGRLRGSGGFYVSVDGGRDWQLRAEPWQDLLVRTLHVSPSDASVLYVTGARPAQTAGEAPAATLFRSQDAGHTWTEHPYRLAEGSYELHVLAVDPRDSRRLYARVLRQRQEPLLVSEDGGASFREVARLAAPILALSVHGDGERVWLGGDAAGLWRSDDAGEHFELIDARLRVGCLAHQGDSLYVCDSGLLSGFQVGRLDATERFEPWLRFRELEALPACPDESLTVLSCALQLSEEQAEWALFRDLVGPDDPAPPATETPDASLPSRPTSGGGCHVVSVAPGATAAHVAVPWLLAWLWLLASPRRRPSRLRTRR